MVAEGDSEKPGHMLTHSVSLIDETVHIEVLGRHLTETTTPALSVLDDLPQNATLKQKVLAIDGLLICEGNCEPSLKDLADKMGNFYDKNKKEIIAKIEGHTIRHINCSILANEEKRCSTCKTYRQTLMVKRTRKKQKLQGIKYSIYAEDGMCTHYNLYNNILFTDTSFSMRTKLSILNTPEKRQHLNIYKHQTKALVAKMQRMQQRWEKVQKESTLILTDDMSSDLMSIMSEEGKTCHITDLPEDSFRKIFWEQQVTLSMTSQCIHQTVHTCTHARLYMYIIGCV